MHFELSPVETRVLGCLLEKEMTTPDYYPLSLNALTTACNQTTNRDPIMAIDEKVVEQTTESLREKKLATVVFGAGSRVQKYRHNLADHFNLSRAEKAILCVLMLRGPQTPGELRTRTDRMHGFASLAEAEQCLEGLSAGSEPMVRMIPAQPGQKERRYIQLYSVHDPALESSIAAPVIHTPVGPTKLQLLEQEVETLKSELQTIKHELGELKKQLGI